MPWTGKEFASRHNKKLKGPAALKASQIANAILRSGGSEGVAIATASKYANKMPREKKPKYRTHYTNYGSLDGSED